MITMNHDEMLKTNPLTKKYTNEDSKNICECWDTHPPRMLARGIHEVFYRWDPQGQHTT